MSESAKKEMEIRFTKMHGAGNDYVYLDATTTLPDCDLQQLSIKISDRHFGIGSDGLVVIMRSEVADFRMRMFNSDGSEAQMCGNASRCIGKYVYDRGLTTRTEVTLETLGGIKVLHLHIKDGVVDSVTVDMGEPCFERVTNLPAGETVITCEGETFPFTPVNMGNPHAVIFGEGIVDDRHVLGIGPHLEVHPAFPEKANIEFAEIRDRANIRMRVWERGTGETLACGTGACATAVAAITRGLADREVTIHLTGGDLKIFWDPDTNHVMMTGPAAFICDGIFYL